MKISQSSELKKSENFVLFISEQNKIYNENKLSKEIRTWIDKLVRNDYLKSNEVFKSYFGREGIENILLVKLKNKIVSDDFRLIGAKVAKIVQEFKINDLAVLIPNIDKLPELNILQAITEGLILGSYQYAEFITDKNNLKSKLKKLEFITTKNLPAEELKKAVEIGSAVNFTRDLVNTPPSKLNPSSLEKIAREVAKQNNLKITVFQEKDLLKKGMECLANVGFGSTEKSRLVILEYKPKSKKNKKPIILVGKGITFDSGGVNLKPAKGGFLEYMKDDMAGSATVLSLIRLASILKLDLHIISLMAISENMIGCSAYKPGDILKAYNGKTVEILNTDAEGRLALADALAYASKDLNPELIIDLATLTGAAMIALGYDYTPIIGNDAKLIEKIKVSGKNTAEKVWELPLDPCYKRYMKGKISDLINSHEGINAGVITAATFLEEFVEKDIPWTHFDIAGSTMSMRGRADEPGGATGTMTRLLFDFLENY